MLEKKRGWRTHSRGKWGEREMRRRVDGRGERLSPASWPAVRGWRELLGKHQRLQHQRNPTPNPCSYFLQYHQLHCPAWLPIRGLRSRRQARDCLEHSLPQSFRQGLPCLKGPPRMEQADWMGKWMPANTAGFAGGGRPPQIRHPPAPGTLPRTKPATPGLGAQHGKGCEVINT